MSTSAPAPSASSFLVIGERTNITGSPKFSKALKAGDWDACLAIARQQVESGANVLDINVDEALIDGEATMVKFLNLIAAEPEISRVPIMVDSSKWTRAREGPAVPAGQGHRQLDLAERRRSRIPAPRETVRCAMAPRPS